MERRFFIWIEKQLVGIDPMKVACLQTKKNHTRICLEEDIAYEIRITLENVIKKFPPDFFVRVHRGLAISIYYVDRVKDNYLAIGEEVFPIAKQYYKNFISKLTILNG